ncbi:MAG: pyridoxamine 5'-phosphate oxidase family protein [Pseudomonadota bacterium]|nr:pyridoxamine 5'-phosphate oxidase family protein [Sphingomonas sp.]MDQ3479147.1 pyridoxamine 5'-phosphate oxidase family protein [Pseudomonadota bacterium]
MADTQHRLEGKFWEELKSSPFVMLGLQGVDDALTRPMTAQIDNGTIYFFAAHSEELVKGLQRSDRAVSTFASKGHTFFASIHGKLALSNDREVIERLWNPMIAAWYKEGKDDPNLALLRFDAGSADVWEGDAGSTLKAAAIRLLGRDPGKQHQDEHRAEIAL